MNEIRTSIILDDAQFQDAAKRVIDAANGIVDSQRKIDPATDGSARAFERLRRSLDPAYDAEKKLEKATRDADAAMRAGKITVEERARALDLLRNKLDPATSSMFRFGQSIGQDLNARMAGFGGQLGIVGNALMALGPGGLVAATALGGLAAAGAAVVGHLRATGVAMADLADQAARVGTNAATLAQLQDVFLSNASGADELQTALEALQAKIGEAAHGSAAAQKAFVDAGIGLDRLGEIGGDATAVLQELAGKSGLTADQVDGLTGKVGRGLLPALTALREQGLGPVDEALQAAVEHMGRARDESELLAKRWERMGAESAAQLQDALNGIKGGLLDLVDTLNRAGAASQTFWQRVLDPKAWQNLDSMRRAIREGVGLQSADTSIEALTGPKFPQLSVAASAPITIRPAETGGGGGRSASRAVREPSLGLEMGKPFGNQLLLSTGGGLDRVETEVVEPSYAFKQHAAEADDFYEQLDKISRKTEENIGKSKEWFDQIQLNTLGIHEAASGVADLFTQTITGQKKVSQLLVEVPALLQQIILKRMTELAITKAIGSVGNVDVGDLLGGLLGGATSNPNTTTGTPFMGSNEDVQKALSGAGDSLQKSSADLTASAGQLGSGGAAGDLTKAAGGMLTAIVNAAAALAGSSSSSSGGGLLSALFGLFGGSGAAATGTGASAGAAPGATMGGYEMTGSAEMMIAHGAAFDRGNVLAFARGGVVHRPTLFAMASGAGLMGEAGPEAVLPLRRTASGDLGVVSGGKPAVVVNINNNAGAKIRTEQREDKDKLTIDVLVDSVEREMASRMTRPGTPLNRAYRTAADPVRAR